MPIVKPWSGIILAAALFGSLPCLGQTAHPAITPLPPQWTQAFSRIRFDPHPPQLTRGSHYYVSDENRHDLFREAIRNKGGVYIGLGTDQNYLMAGWCRPDILIPLDFDQVIVDLHSVFGAFFLNAATPEDFLGLWDAKREKAAIAILEKTHEGSPDLKALCKAFRQGRRFVNSRLNRIKRFYEREKVPTFLSDPEQYRFIVHLFENGRVFPVRGDLTAKTTVKDVAHAVRSLGLAVRVLYLSNAEQYFKYNQDFKENMLSLPLDAQSVVIRTAGTSKPWSLDGRYEYIIQSGPNFHAWMKHPKTGSMWRIIRDRRVNKKTGSAVVDALPPDAETAP